MRYYFGIYHWRRRFRRLFVGAAAVAAGLVGWRRASSLRGRAVALAALLVGLRHGRRPVETMLSPPPWRVRTGKYRRLVAVLSVPSDATVLDVGCGTGRSLVGLSTGLPDDARVLGLDVFDDRVILGNGPRLAARNARAAGLDAEIVAGDGSRLPTDDGSVDVVTACRVLHDLPKDDAERALAEFRRVLDPDGRLGVLELPLPHEADADPAAYWEQQLSAAGFEVARAERVGADDGYLLFTATPS